MTKTTMYADGGARGNPGPAGSGAVLLDENGRVIAERYAAAKTGTLAV